MLLTKTGPKELVLPRFGTPRNPDLPTRGGEIADVAARLLLPMMPHLRHMADVLGEYDPDNDGHQVYETGDMFVNRQVGKTMGFLTPYMVHRCTKVPYRLGRQRVMFAMHDRQKTRLKLEQDIIPLLDAAAESFVRISNPKGRPGRSRREWKSSLNNGSESLQFGQGNYLVIDTPSKKAGHSQTLDVVCLDEIRFAVDDRVEQGAGPTMITRRDRMLLRASTAGDEESFYMWPLVVAGRKRCELGVHGSSAYFEYSIPDECDLHDPDVWFEYHPAVGRTISIDDILSKLHLAEDHPDESKLDTFRQEYANQWVRHPALSSDPHVRVIDPNVWAVRKVPASTVFTGPGVLGVDVAPKGAAAAIDVVGQIAGGRRLVRVLDVQDATWWLETAMIEHGIHYRVSAVAYDAGGPAKAMAGAIARAAAEIAKATRQPCEVVKISGSDYKAACQGLVSGFVENMYCHVDQAWLNAAVEGAIPKQLGDGWVWDRRSSFDEITPVPAATAALWAYELNPPPTPRRSAYEDDGLMTV